MGTGKRHVVINRQCKEWNVLYLDWINISILVVKLYYNVQDTTTEKTVKGSQDPCTISYKFM